jgi:hypothetical protein
MQSELTRGPIRNLNSVIDAMDGCKSHLLPTQEDKEDIHLAHQYRLSLPSRPSQSSFRVLALLFFEETSTNPDNGFPSVMSHLPPWVRQQTPDGRHFIVGTNDEPGYMGGAICAERAAMVQLRFLPQFAVTKLVITTDCLDPVAPGMLCREFMAGHSSVPMDLRVVCAGSICMRCRLSDDALYPGAREYIRARHMGTTDLKESGIPPHAECVHGHSEHSLPTLVTALGELYTYPSPYTRLAATQSVALGEAYSESQFSDRDLEGLPPTAKRLLELAILEAKQQLTTSPNGSIHPIQFGAAVMLEDETIVTSHQSSALEYGCTLDAVSQLAPYLQDETCAPVLLVQADQYGIAHAPFAPARSFLSEYGYDECRVLLHHHHPAPLDGDIPNISTHDHPSFDKLCLREVRVCDLAPNAPAWIAETSVGDEDNDENDSKAMTGSKSLLTITTQNDNDSAAGNPGVQGDKSHPWTPGESSFDETSQNNDDGSVVASAGHGDNDRMLPDTLNSITWDIDGGTSDRPPVSLGVEFLQVSTEMTFDTTIAAAEDGDLIPVANPLSQGQLS